MPVPWLDLWLQSALGLNHTPSIFELHAAQVERIRRTLAHAAIHSPFYRKRLRNISPESIRSLPDLSTLPRTTPEELRKHPDEFLATSQDEIERVVSVPSSGTSGPGKRIFYTPGDLERTIHFFGLGMCNLIHPGETALILLPGERPDSVGRLLAKSLKSIGAKALLPGLMDNDTHSPNSILKLFNTQDIHCIIGTPAHVHVLAAHWTHRMLPRNKVRSVLLCWDTIPKTLVHFINRAFGCQTFQHWGMVETGLGGAVECTHHSGMHLREADIFVEITDPVDGTPLPDGAWGEMLITTLTRRAMPLIRYRSGDRGRILPGTCTCGSPLRRLDTHIDRMNADCLLTGGSTISPSLLSEKLYGLPGLADFAARLECPATRQDKNGNSISCAFPQQTLVVDVSTVIPDDPSPLRMVAESLAMQPALSVAKDHGLKVVINSTGHSGPARPGLGKRVLHTPAHQRSSS